MAEGLPPRENEKTIIGDKVDTTAKKYLKDAMMFSKFSGSIPFYEIGLTMAGVYLASANPEGSLLYGVGSVLTIIGSALFASDFTGLGPASYLKRKSQKFVNEAIKILSEKTIIKDTE